MKKTEADIRLDWPSSNQYHDNRARLQITDRRSGRVILEAELLAEDVAGILANRGAVVPVEILGDSHYALTGKYQLVERVGLPAELTAQANARPYAETGDPSEGMVNWASAYIMEHGWSEYGYQRTNTPGGWALIVRKYVDERPEEKR